MRSLKVDLAGPFFSRTGYGQQARVVLHALKRQGVECETIVLPVRPNLPPGGDRLAVLAKKLAKRQDAPKNYLRILNCIPPQFPGLVAPESYNIGFCPWETDRISQAYERGSEFVDELWVGDEVQKEAYRVTGKPVRVMPLPLSSDLEELEPSARAEDVFHAEEEEPDVFRFYSVFEWRGRKNPKLLLQAYWQAFSAKEPVVLSIQTFRGPAHSNLVKRSIFREIKEWQGELNGCHFPKVEISFKTLTRKELLAFHQRGDCFVLATRGEGWCLPAMEAMAAGNPVIATSRGGILSLIRDDFAWPISFQWVPVHWPASDVACAEYFSPEQRWAEPSRAGFIAALREAYENPQLVRDKGQLARRFVKENFSAEVVGRKMVERLEAIMNSVSGIREAIEDAAGKD